MHRTIFYTVCDSWTAISYIIVKSKCELMEVLKQSEECKGWHHLKVGKRILNDKGWSYTSEEMRLGAKQVMKPG